MMATKSEGNSFKKKQLTTFDLISLGIGSTLGVGIYVLAGDIAKNMAGPAVILSFFIAAVASAFAGLCYAELGSGSPESGSVYSYCRSTFGEFIGFLMGWNLITEYVIGTASVAKALSEYMDTLCGNVMEEEMMTIFKMNLPYFAKYFDVLAFFICFSFALALAYGLKESLMVNNILTSVNVLIVVLVIVFGSFYVKVRNWSLPASDVPKNAGNGGFFPYGWEGVLRGSGPCFYGFIGFDCIATTGEEVKNPQKSLPVAIIVSLTIIFFCYFGIAAVITLMLPYYDQDEIAPIQHAFESNGAHWMTIIVTIGSLVGLYASMFGAFFPISRILYKMSKDGLLSERFGKIHPKHDTPFFGTLISGLGTGLIAAVFDVEQLINLNSIGTLLAYTMIAVCVILLRYSNSLNNLHEPPEENTLLLSGKKYYFFDFRSSKNPSATSELSVQIQLFSFCILAVTLSFLLAYNFSNHYIFLTVIIVTLVMLLISMASQPRAFHMTAFQMPLVPFIPLFTILLNVYMMMLFDYYTWGRFFVWMALVRKEK